MSELSRMAQPLLDHPVVPAPPIGDLRRRGQRRRQRHLLGGSTAVLLVVAVVAVATLAPSSPKPVGNPGSSSNLTAYIQKGVAVSDSTLESVGLPASVTAPNSVPNGTALTQDALVVALSRFGTFSNLGQTISSSSTDVYPGLQSWSFKDSVFTSSSLEFAPAEVYSSTPNSTGTGYEPLQSLSALQSQAYGPYGDRGYPFIDIGGKYVALGASANSGVLQNLTLDQIASQLDNPSSAVAEAVNGTANYLIAAMCSVTSTSAAPICTAPFIAQAQAGMAANPVVPGG
jgi:hypothetical protein